MGNEMHLLAHAAIKAIAKGRYFIELADGESDLSEAQALRGRCFGLNARDRDPYDANFLHVLIRSAQSRALVACFRLHLLEGHALGTSYSAQYYALEALARYPGALLEVGRFCIDPRARAPDITRLAWAMITRLVDGCQVTLLFGCSSFAGLDPEKYLDAFAWLRERHLAPKEYMPAIKSAQVIPFAEIPIEKPDPRRAMLGTPALLRSYLAMGGWVSDHAVIDAEMNTLHVFTGVEIARIPPARKRLLRAMSQ